ncbi:unnamed protein product [Leuciscus chuanchicus]
MVWCVCGDHDVKHSRLSTQLSSREMASKRLSRWSGLDYVFFLVLLLLCHPVTSNTTATTTGPPVVSAFAGTLAINMTTATGGTTDNFTTESPSYSLTVPLTTSSLTELNTTTMTETSTTSSNKSTTIPAMTITAELHSTGYLTTENTPYTSTENTTFSESTTISTSTENTTLFESTTISTSTENTTLFESTTISTSTENTTLFESTTISTSTENTTLFESTTISASTENTTLFESTTISTSTENTTFLETTTNSTAFTATPEPSSSAYANYTTPLMTTINQTFTTTVAAPTPCVQSCDVFYWITTSVEIKGTPQSEQNITTHLKELFRLNLDACVPIFSDSHSVSVRSLMDTNLTTTSIRIAQCYILLKLRVPANVCCLRNTVTEINSNINVSVVGQIERVDPKFFEKLIMRKQVKCLQCFTNFHKSLSVKLDTAMDLCDISTALKALLEPHNASLIFGGVVSRVAICSHNSTNPLQQTLSWQPSLSANFSSEVFCNESNFNGYCSEGSTFIPLNDSCNSSTTLFQDITTTPPSFTSTPSNTTSINTTVTPVPTSLSNTTSINTTVTPVSTSVNVTSSPANVTTSGSSNTSGILDVDGLLKLSANASSLNATQVNQLLSQLESLLSGPNVSLALANTSVNIVNNLLDVPVDVITPFSKRAIGIVDTVGLKLVVSGTSQSVLSQSLALAVKKVDGANFQETSFSLLESSNLQIRSNPGLETEDIVFRVGSTALGSVTLPASLTQNLTTDQQQLVSRVQFNFFQKSTFFQDKSLGERELNSGILGSSVANLSISNLPKDVLITLRNTKPIPTNRNASCVFWDFTFNGNSGGWNSSGCRVLNSSAEETQCACNHLTSFGILLDISKTSIPPEHIIILTYITYIGCGISAIFLSITLLTYLAFGKLRKDIPSKILIQLCLALLLLNLVFLLDGWLALYPDAVGLCISTAFFLHYFLLASFTWMALEAFHMYLALVKVFNTYITRFMVKIGFAGWGIPLIIVIIVIAIDKDNYGLVHYGKYADGTTDDFCWIKNDIAFYVAVVAYFCLVFLLNFTMFIVVMIQLCRIKKQNPHNVQIRSGWQEARSVAGLTVLLGLTWGFAFFAWGPVNLAFMYLFAIFNTLQGLFIFIFHCAMKENVRRQWRTYLCCGRLRLSENSEWSRTATQKINKVSKEKTSFHSSNSNNSRLSFLNHDSLVSDVPMGIGNPMDDRIITAGEEPISGSDVVLNEINDQYRGQRSY